MRGKPFAVGDATTLVPMLSVYEADDKKLLTGEEWLAEEELVHWECPL